MASNGWSARLCWQWILYNTIAFVAVLTAVAVLSWMGADLLHLSFTNRSWLVALLVATAGLCCSVACSERCTDGARGTGPRPSAWAGTFATTGRRSSEVSRAGCVETIEVKPSN